MKKEYGIGISHFATLNRSRQKFSKADDFTIKRTMRHFVPPDERKKKTQHLKQSLKK